MRALLDNLARNRKIIVSLVFALALIGVVSASQGFSTDSKVSAAELIQTQMGENSLESGDFGSLEGGDGDFANDGDGGGSQDNTVRTTSGTNGNGKDDENGDGKDDGSGKDEDGKGETGGQLCGFAWGATSEPITPKMGVGWVSFNSKDCDVNGDGTVNGEDSKDGISCPTGPISNYGVTVDDGQNLDGYAWSNTLGWLKFGGLSSFPTAGGNNAQNARINGDGTVTGWARFCAGTATGDCSTMTSRTDGWDGWVSLKGTSPTYGVTVNGDNFGGYSWGSKVAGWINWNAGTGSNVRYCTGAPTQSLAVTLAANPSSGDATLHTTLTATPVLDPSGDTSGASYRFKCDFNSNWSSAQSSNQYSCNYTQPDTSYHPRVEVTIGALVSEGATEVNTNPDTTGGGDLNAVCTVTRPAFVNQPVTWTVNLTETTVGPYDYVFSFSDGLGNTTITDSPNTSEQVIVTYPGPGPKSLNATVTDSAASPISVQCNQNANVIVRPVIIPI